MDETWISSGEAAKMLGYSRAGFVSKFDGVLPCRRFRGEGGRIGYRRWLKAAVLALLQESPQKSA